VNHDPSEGDVMYASPATRDAFLNALDGEDRLLTIRLAKQLATCMNRLPGLTRDALALPIGATYGAAARHILSLGPSTDPRTHK
jgi:hypothetical protein